MNPASTSPPPLIAAAPPSGRAITPRHARRLSGDGHDRLGAYQTARGNGNGHGGTGGRAPRRHSGSTGYLDAADLGYFTSRSADEDLSMMYFKDKPLPHRSLAVRLRGLCGSCRPGPGCGRVCRWAALLTVLALSLGWGYRERTASARLLAALRVDSVEQAIELWASRRRGAAAGSGAGLRELSAIHDKWLRREKAWKQHVAKLHNYTQKEARRAVLDKYGPGPHHVQIQVVLPTYLRPDNSHSEEDVDTFEVELAPLKDMPHSVHLFLEQVSHGLWSRPGGLHFHINTAHILVAGPTTKAARVAFQTHGLSHLAFPEYSAAFPHEKFTLGFAGRPGGPQFYINLANNTGVHGPGGQRQHVLHEFADACFARVASGFNVLRQVLEETDEKHRTLIAGMKVIQWDRHRYADPEDAHWYKALMELDLKDDDAADDVFRDAEEEEEQEQEEQEHHLREHDGSHEEEEEEEDKEGSHDLEDAHVDLNIPAYSHKGMRAHPLESPGRPSDTDGRGSPKTSPVRRHDHSARSKGRAPQPEDPLPATDRVEPPAVLEELPKQEIQ